MASFAISGIQVLVRTRGGAGALVRGPAPRPALVFQWSHHGPAAHRIVMTRLCSKSGLKPANTEFQGALKLAALALLIAAGAVGQTAPPPPPAVVAGIPVNYDEEKAGGYTLPDPLLLLNGKPVRDAKTWNDKRRPELIKLYEEKQFGHAPGKPSNVSYDVFEPGASTFDGKAVRRQLTIRLGDNGPKFDVLIYFPKAATKPVPVLLHMSFSPNASTVDDPEIRLGETWNREHKRVPATRGVGIGKMNPLPWLERGMAVATVYYGDIDPDFDGGFPNGVRAGYPKPGGGDWGTIAAWAWGASRIVDYFEAEKAIDPKRIAIVGVSRLGKTVLWAGASDPRIGLVIASCSGEGGAALSRRYYGETIKHMAARFGYQFAPNYAQYGDRVNEFPVDSHFLISLIAPRPLLLQTGDKDFWSDPNGEYLAAVAAAPVYKLLGAKVDLPAAMPEAGQAFYGTLGYYEHAGGHGTLPGDWEIFMKFVDMHFHLSR